jgi:hypothetical protein
MALTLAQIREKLQASESRGKSTSAGGDSAIYPHWNIAEGATTRIRFLPDSDPKNNFFWVERAMINLEFAGIKGQPESKKIVVKVPCVEMYNDGSVCPILTEVRTWFKDPALEEKGRQYWKKKSYVFQGFVRENAVSDDKTPTNPIRRFTISPQIFNLVKNALMDPEMENLPTDYTAGLDFNIKKTSKGGYADYSTSTWARKETALTPDEATAIEQFGLYNLSDYLPKKPTDVELNIIKEMFEASVDGQPYDGERWANYYKPYGFQGSNSTNQADSAERPQTQQAKVVPTNAKSPVTEDHAYDEEEETPVVAAPAVAAKPARTQSAEDILAMIRNRQQK